MKHFEKQKITLKNLEKSEQGVRRLEEVLNQDYGTQDSKISILLKKTIFP